MTNDPPRLDEFGLIQTLLAPLAEGVPGAFQLTDDAALVQTRPGHELVVTTDAMVAGVHFLPDDNHGDVGRKLLRVNLSDLAGMGAEPAAYLLTLALPANTPPAWVEGFAAGLATDQAEFGVHLIGGDTVRIDGPLALTLTALGWAASGRVLRRAGAAAGDDIHVSGCIGDAALGLALVTGRLAGLDPAAARYFRRRLCRPEPRLELGLRLVGVASAALDVSDGLVADLGHLCAASGVGAVVRLETVPLSAPAKSLVTKDKELLPNLIVGGDDYELVFTAAPAVAQTVARLERELELPLTKVGQVVEGHGLQVVDSTGGAVHLARPGYTHFAPSS